ncbi:unnamed protein product [Ectocarpus sp. 12 AP-2014]
MADTPHTPGPSSRSCHVYPHEHLAAAASPPVARVTDWSEKRWWREAEGTRREALPTWLGKRIRPPWHTWGHGRERRIWL